MKKSHHYQMTTINYHFPVVFFRKARLAKGITEKKLAKKINRSQQQISKLELGECGLSLELALLLLDAMNIDISEFISDLFQEEKNLKLITAIYDSANKENRKWG